MDLSHWTTLDLSHCTFPMAPFPLGLEGTGAPDELEAADDDDPHAIPWVLVGFAGRGPVWSVFLGEV